MVAYRFDALPPRSCYFNFEQANAVFSTSFVLVRHRLQYPAEYMKQPSETPPSCVFYSLYMHLRHWEAYEEDESLKRPEFWEKEPDRMLVGKDAKDDVPDNIGAGQGAPAGGKGIRLRGDNDVIIGWAPRGTYIRLTGTQDSRGYRRIAGFDGDYFRRSGLSEQTLLEYGKVFVKELEQITDAPKVTDIVHFPMKPVEGKPNEKKLHEIKAGELVGHLGYYMRFNPEVISSSVYTSRPVVHLEVFSPELEDFIKKCRKLEPDAPASAKTLLRIAKGAKPVTLPMFDLTLDRGELLMLAEDSPKEGLLVKLSRNKLAGSADVMLRTEFAPGEAGYKQAGQYYLKAGDANTKHYFFAALTADGKSPIMANQFSTSQQHPKRKVFVPDAGKAVWVLRSWYESRASHAGNRNGVVVIDNGYTQAWGQFPLKEKQNEVKGSVAAIQVIDVKKKGNPLVKYRAKDDKGVDWFEVKYPIIEEDGVFTIKGWVNDKDFEKVTRCSPWAWPGFELTEEDPLTPLDWFKRRLARDYTPSSPMLKQLYKLLDADGNKVLTEGEIRQGWSKPWLAQALSRQVLEHKSEWGLPMSEWDALDKAMLEGAEKLTGSRFRPDKVWEEEKKRIAKLVWWDKVAGKHGFPTDIKVWHVHPLGLIENFAGIKKHPVIVVDGEIVELEFLDEYIGDHIEESDYEAAAVLVGCETAVFKAIGRQESGSAAWYKFAGWDSVPKILFERHKFHNFTNGQFDSIDSNISNAVAGGYGLESAQYKRLLKAYKLNKTAALKSASWGKFQVMGFNHQAAGYSSVEEFVRDLSMSEKNHLKAAANFAKNTPALRQALINKNWSAIALHYNGPQYAQNNYDTHLQQFYNEIVGQQ
ncbi:MAG: N-acetylmuramidase family protein [Betaproteobacteria bacterium]|nr:N-acetylmuramidase family protein [Betaproteobacteria bacterium]